MPKPDYKALCKRLSDALLKVRPLGGSEMFIRVGSGEDENFIADPDYCGSLIDDMLSKNRNLTRDLMLARKAR